MTPAEIGWLFRASAGYVRALLVAGALVGERRGRHWAFAAASVLDYRRALGWPARQDQ